MMAVRPATRIPALAPTAPADLAVTAPGAFEAAMAEDLTRA
jgi:hypothetical protein